MLERYVIPGQDEVERELAPARRWWSFDRSFNVAPGRYVPVLRLHEGETKGVMMRWGLTPAAGAGRSEAHRLQAVASGGILASQDCAAPWLRGQRCLVPLAGYFVWRQAPRGHLQPHYLQVVGQPLVTVAALWDGSPGEHDDVLESFAVVMVPGRLPWHEAGSEPALVPAVLPRGQREPWLRAQPADAMEQLRRLPAPALCHHPVGPWVNVAGCDDPTLIRRVEPQTFDLGASFRPPSRETV